MAHEVDGTHSAKQFPAWFALGLLVWALLVAVAVVALLLLAPRACWQQPRPSWSAIGAV